MSLIVFLFCLILYMAVGLPTSLMIWASLMMAKRGDINQGYDRLE